MINHGDFERMGLDGIKQFGGALGAAAHRGHLPVCPSRPQSLNPSADQLDAGFDRVDFRGSEGCELTEAMPEEQVGLQSAMHENLGDERVCQVDADLRNSDLVETSMTGRLDNRSKEFLSEEFLHHLVREAENSGSLRKPFV